jgi:hypothetical protein
MTPIVLAIIGAGLLIGLGMGFIGLQIHRRGSLG